MSDALATVVLYTDATLLPDGTAGFGASLVGADGVEIATLSERAMMAPGQSNRAEFEAARRGLLLAASFGARPLLLRVDSATIPQSLSSKRPRVRARITELLAAIECLGGPCRAEWIKRRLNWRADMLAGLAVGNAPKALRAAVMAPCDVGRIRGPRSFWQAQRALGVVQHEAGRRRRKRAGAETAAPAMLQPLRPRVAATLSAMTAAVRLVDAGAFSSTTSLAAAGGDWDEDDPPDYAG